MVTGQGEQAGRDSLSPFSYPIFLKQANSFNFLPLKMGEIWWLAVEKIAVDKEGMAETVLLQSNSTIQWRKMVTHLHTRKVLSLVFPPSAILLFRSSENCRLQTLRRLDVFIPKLFMYTSDLSKSLRREKVIIGCILSYF